MIHVVVGLGNPGRDYIQTRHNIGFLILDHFVSSHGAIWRMESRWQSEMATVKFEKEGAARVLKLIKPLTFMNLSGVAVKSFLSWHQISAEEILVVADDVALPTGQLRFRTRGSSGGHNGLASIEHHIQTQDFARLRCGVGPLPSQKDLAEYVLEKFSSVEKETVVEMIEKAGEAIECACLLGLDAAMNQFNQLQP